MNLIEANTILNTLVILLIFVCCHICRLGSFMKDFSYSIEIQESIAMSYFKTFRKVGKVLAT